MIFLTRAMAAGVPLLAVLTAAVLWSGEAWAEPFGSVPPSMPGYAPASRSALQFDAGVAAQALHLEETTAQGRWLEPIDDHWRIQAGFRGEVSGAAGARLFQGSLGHVDGYVLEWSHDEADRHFAVLRRAVGHSAGFRQVLRLGQGAEASVGVRFDSESADVAYGRRARQENRELEAGLAWTLPGSVGARAFYGYRSPDSSMDRFSGEKERHRIRLELGHNLSDWFRIRASFLSRIHDSNAIPSERGSYLACIGFVAKY